MDTADAVRSSELGETATAGVDEPIRKANGVSAVWHVALLAFALGLIVFWYTPAVLYSDNEQQFRYPLLQLLPLLGAPLVATVVVLPLPALLMPRAARRFYAALLAALTIVVWVRGFFLVADYGLLDGAIKLPAFSAVQLVVSVGIIVVAAVVLFVAPIPARLVVGAIVALIVAMLAHTTVVVAQDPNPVRSLERAQVDPLYSFGKDQNLIMILLDSLQSDIFAETMQERPDLGRALDGFTYFPNTLGIAPSTYGTMPTVHSARLHTPGQSMSEHFQRSIRKRSFLTGFAEAGWHTTHMNPIGTVCPQRVDSCFVYDTTAITSGRARLTQQAAELVDLSMFRLAPPELKGTVYNNDRWRFRKAFKSASIQESSDTALVDITKQARIGKAAKTVKFLHLQNTHPPATRSADCALLEKPISPMTRRAAKDLAICAMTRIGALVAKLKALDIYDKTSIVMFADTGYKGLGSRITVEREWTGPKTKTAASWNELIGIANPFLAVKPPRAHGALARSNSEMWLAELRTIACSLTGGCGDEPADWDSPDPERVRRYLLYQWHDRFWHASQLKNERRFEIRGRMADPMAWNEVTGITLPVTSKVTFGKSDSAAHFGNGWGPVLDEGDGARWGVGKHAAMFLRLPNDAKARLSFDVASLPELKDQTIFAKVNLHPVGDPVRVDATKQTISFDVPRWATDDKEIDEVLLFFGKRRQGTHTNRHIRLQQSLAVRFDELRIEIVR